MEHYPTNYYSVYYSLLVGETVWWMGRGGVGAVGGRMERRAGGGEHMPCIACAVEEGWTGQDWVD